MHVAERVRLREFEKQKNEIALKGDGRGSREEEVVRREIDKIFIKSQPEWRRTKQFIRFTK